MKRQKQLNYFYKELLSKDIFRVVFLIGVGFLEFFFLISVLLISEYTLEVIPFAMGFGFLAPYLYLYNYRYQIYARRNESIYHRLKYLPIPKSEIKRFQIGRLGQFVAINGIAVFAARVLTEIASFVALGGDYNQSIIMEKVLVLILLVFVEPFLLNLLVLLFPNRIGI